MLPSPRAKSPVNWLELVIKTTIVFGLGWFLVSNMLPLNRGAAASPELAAADQALKAKNVAGARVQFDKLIAKTPKSTLIYRDIFVVCGADQQGDLLETYAQRAQQACKDAPKADQGEMYRALAGAYLDCGGKFVGQALPVAEKAFDLDPDNMESMNTLAYTIAETDAAPARLTQAQNLIHRALTELDSKTGVSDRPLYETMFNNTYAWVLYKQGLNGPATAAPDKFTRAANILIDVVATLPDDIAGTVASDIYYHLGAIYTKTGQVTEARDMLAIALHDNPGNVAATQALAALPVVSAAATSPAQAAPQSKPETAGRLGGAPAFTPLLPPRATTSSK